LRNGNRPVLLLLAALAACGGSAAYQGTDAGASAPADPAVNGTDGGAASGADAGNSTVADAGASTGADAGASAGADAGVTPAASCIATPLLQQLGMVGGTKLLVGADMTDSVAEQAPFAIRYLYLAGGLADGTGTCNSCTIGCTAAGASCGNSSAACGWWGCWQDLSLSPGQYVRDLIAKTKATGQLPMITYYELLQTSRVVEGDAEVTVAVRDVALMTRFFNDWRFVLLQIGTSPALLHVEPDFWGYAEKLNQDPHQLPAAVATANPVDCLGQENSVAGMGRCLIAMVRKYAPKAKVGLHGSGWGTGTDAISNRNPLLDVAAEGRRLADFLLACGGGEADFVGIDLADRDAGFERTLGIDTFWDVTNATLPNFLQAFAWARALTERLGRPALWWQLPLGNMSLPDVDRAWQDNKLDYFFSHTADVARTNAFGLVFGAGEVRQTNPSTDHGNLISKVQGLSAAGGQLACVP
jgi:hypothetical protein